MPAASSDTTAESSSFATVGAVTLCYESFGDPAAPAILLIMGLGTQMIGWDVGFCRMLAARGFRVIRFDNRDIGRSTWLDHEEVPSPMSLFTKARLGMAIKVPYSLKDMAADTIGLLDVLGIPRAHIVGASMGGMIGQEIAIDHPERMLSFTSIMSTTGNSRLPPPTPEAFKMMMAPPARDQAAFLETYRDVWRVLRAGIFPEDEARDLERSQAVWARGYHPAGSGRQFGAIFASGDRTEALKRVRVPTLVIHGKADPLVPVAAGIATAEAIPGAKLRLIDAMGHALPMSTWREVTDAIAEHAGGVAGGGS